MTKCIQGIKKVEEVIGRWSPCDLAIIEDMVLGVGNHLADTKMVITALFQLRSDSWPNFDREMFRIIIEFYGVGNLSLKGFGGGSVQIMGFDIHFVGDRGLEGINYKIEDYEDGKISFDCSGICIRSIERVAIQHS